MAINVRKLGHALGAEVSGVDLSRPIDDQTFGEINRAFLANCVLVFRGQSLTREQHVAFSRRFGQLDNNLARSAHMRTPEVPEIFLVTAEPVPSGQTPGGVIGDDWHTDNSHLPVAAAASLLRALELPDVGGDTMFCNMYRAWESLSPLYREWLDGRFALHDMSVARETQAQRTPAELEDIRRRNPPVYQPIARRHDVTGRKALYVSEMTTVSIEGLTAEESAPILAFLYEHSTPHENVYRHVWKPADMILWDNRCVMHIALADYDLAERRTMYRTTLRGDPSGRIAATA